LLRSGEEIQLKMGEACGDPRVISGDPWAQRKPESSTSGIALTPFVSGPAGDFSVHTTVASGGNCGYLFVANRRLWIEQRIAPKRIIKCSF
jgi:hypothetical protein